MYGSGDDPTRLTSVGAARVDDEGSSLRRFASSRGLEPLQPGAGGLQEHADGRGGSIVTHRCDGRAVVKADDPVSPDGF